MFLVKNRRLFFFPGRFRYDFKQSFQPQERFEESEAFDDRPFLTLTEMGTFNNTLIFFDRKKKKFLLRVLGKMNLMENIILGPWMSREIPHSMTIYLILGLFIKSSVTSDYNEPSVSVTHVLRMISYLSALCVLRPPRLWGAWGSCTVSRSTVEALHKC